MPEELEPTIHDIQAYLRGRSFWPSQGLGSEPDTDHMLSLYANLGLCGQAVESKLHRDFPEAQEGDSGSLVASFQEALNTKFAALLERIDALEAAASAKPTVIYDLDELHSVKQPIHITLQEIGDTVIATWPEIHLYGEGETASDAIAVLKAEIVSLYDDLSSTTLSKLGVLPRRWLNTLKQVVLKNA